MSIEQKRLESCMPPLPGSSQILARPNTQQKKGELPQRTRNQILQNNRHPAFGKLAFAVSIGHLQSHRSGQSRSGHAKVSPRKPKQTYVGKDPLSLYHLQAGHGFWSLHKARFSGKTGPKNTNHPGPLATKKPPWGPHDCCQRKDTPS